LSAAAEAAEAAAAVTPSIEERSLRAADDDF